MEKKTWSLNLYFRRVLQRFSLFPDFDRFFNVGKRSGRLFWPDRAEARARDLGDVVTSLLKREQRADEGNVGGGAGINLIGGKNE